jgi:predicted NAD-dependent protein-ADP-ribosyltransferase YbiA (DUF1768 family)
LYKDIVKLAILQGTYQSALSIKNVIPIEDYSAIVAPIIAPLVVNEDVKAFADGYFQRNNFKDSDAWKVVHPKFFVAKSPQQDIDDVQPVAQDAFGNEIYQYVNTTTFPSIPLLKNKSSERKILILNETFNYLDTQEDFIIVPRVVIDRKTGVKVDMFTGRTVTDSMISAANKKGNQIYKSVYGYQKVKHMDGTPVTFTSVYKGEDMVNHVYKLINLYGDNPYTTEYYSDFKPSVLNNNTMKIDSEIPNNDIIDHFAPQLAEDMAKSIGEAVPSQPMEQAPTNVSGEKINIYAGTGENAELSNFASRPFEDKTEWQGLTFKSVEGAFQAAKIQLSDMFDKNDNLTKEGDELLNKLQEASGAEAKALGRKVTGLNVKEWDRLSSNIMKGLLLESFKQNPKALQRLLATGNAILTHTQDKGKWGKEFPRLLMEVREELRPTQPTSAPEAVSEYGLTAANFEGNVPDYAMAISNFYESLTPEQKTKLESLEDIIADYESIPFEYSYNEYIESLKCKL